MLRAGSLESRVRQAVSSDDPGVVAHTRAPWPTEADVRRVCAAASREASCPTCKTAMPFPISPRSVILSATWRMTNPPQERRRGQGQRRVGARKRATTGLGNNESISLRGCGLASFLTASLRAAAAIMIVYRLHGEK